MAETNLGVKLSAEGVSQVEDAFRRLAKSANTFQKEGSLLGSTLNKLVGIAAGFFAFDKIKDFIIDGTKAAMENQQAMNLLAARLKTIGVAYDEVQPKLKTYLDTMINLGREDEMMMDSIGKLSVKTKDLDQAMKLSKLASDLAASGIGDVASNTDGLVRILMGKGTRAMLQFGAVVKDNATITEQLAAVQQRVTRTTEQWADSAEGRVARMQTQFSEIKEELGYGFLITLTNLSNAFNDFYNKNAKDTTTWAKFISEILNVGLPSAWKNVQIAALKAGNAILSWDMLDEAPGKIGEFFKNEKRINDETIAMLGDEQGKLSSDFEQMWKDLKSVSANGSSAVGGDLDELSQEAEDAAKKIKTAFESMAKSIMGKITDSTNKISDLREELKGLGEDIDEQLAKSEEAYKGDLDNLARSSQEKIDSIDKEIAETEKKKDKGWRDQIEKLQADKAKENAVLQRLAGQGVDITKEASKDELTILQETHTKELEEIRKQGEIKKLELQKQILEQQILSTKLLIEATKPGGMENLVKTEANLKSWETNPVININFNGNVNDADTFIKMMTDALNREAALRQYK